MTKLESLRFMPIERAAPTGVHREGHLRADWDNDRHHEVALESDGARDIINGLRKLASLLEYEYLNGQI